jgi:hypothetical protein
MHSLYISMKQNLIGVLPRICCSDFFSCSIEAKRPADFSAASFFGEDKMPSRIVLLPLISSFLFRLGALLSNGVGDWAYNLKI